MFRTRDFVVRCLTTANGRMVTSNIFLQIPPGRSREWLARGVPHRLQQVAPRVSAEVLNTFK